MEGPKVEFALGSEVSPGHFFKSDFAKSFLTCTRDSSSKSLGYDFYEEDHHQLQRDDSPTNFYSLNWNPNKPMIGASVFGSGAAETCTTELDKLRKKCQLLEEENERLRNRHCVNVGNNQPIDTVYLQTQVDTLQWQLKQCEANRQMYRSLMEQVARFLDRARKSLDILHEKSAPCKARYNSSVVLDKSSSRVPRSRSVHAVHDEEVRSSCASSTTSSSSSCSTSSSSSRFARAKSVAQIPGINSKDVTWSMHRRHELLQGKGKLPAPQPTEMMSKSALDVTKEVQYRRPKQSELHPDDVPPEKLSQEAFRLMRTVQSLLVMREPELTRVTEDASLGLPTLTNFANSTSLHHQEVGSSSSDRGSEEDDEANRTLTGIKDEASEVALAVPAVVTPLCSTPARTRPKKLHDRKSLSIIKDWALGSTSTKTSTGSTTNKPTTSSVSSAEDESGFSSMSSFQEVGLPNVSPIKNHPGCHTEVGLPLPDKHVQHRRWSSTPSDFQGVNTRRHSTQTDSLSVWV